ncbi:hypothetical protein STXM2123_2098 [Streptomyces sp. F-3]|jgi:hypothetical protein|uniref:Carbon catabolit repression protein n=1 Tax=Streptomyces thermogriseus TaxID=75292 RepID=A0ABP4DA85_9ACTN|nr:MULTISPECIES: DUF5304 domain-containing protein [Streptomyces]MDN5384964.1 DUF5304 domain-containing protein [Streptomyces sp. LB8]GAT81397.1 hypothetical protein STXM2123_2098 [Streptomyces sp. F-3]
MSEERVPSDAAQEEPGNKAPQADADAWATACAEDLARERDRRRSQYGPPPGAAAEELRKFVDTVAEKLSSFQPPLLGGIAGPMAQQVVRQVVQQAKAVVEPVIERNPDVFDHLAAAGSELLAAYRSAVESHERRWTMSRTGDTDDGPNRLKDELTELDDRPGGRRDRGEGTGGGERIDLD